MMNIAYLQDDFPPQSFGGAGISTFELAKAVQEAGHEVSVITTCRDEKDKGESEYQGLRVFKIPSRYDGRWRAYVSLKNSSVVAEVEKILTQLQPDIVHANNIHAHLSYASLGAAKRHAGAVVLTFRDTMAATYGKLDTKNYLERLDPRTSWLDHLRDARKRYNPLRNVFIKRYLRSCDALFSVSDALRDALVAHGIKGVETVHTGMNAEAWHPDPARVAEFRKKHELEGKQVVLFGGRLSAEKGGGAALKALALVAKEVPQAVLLVVGVVDEFARAMQEEAKKLGVADKVVYTGWIEGQEKQDAFYASDIVLAPSIYLDPLPRVVLEGMVAGKPVIASKYGGAPEAVLDGETGFIVDPRNPEEVAEKLRALFYNPAKAEALGAAARARIEMEFNLKDVAERYITYYNVSISKKPKLP